MVEMTPFDIAILFGKLRPVTDANDQGAVVEMYERQVYLSHRQARALYEGLGRSLTSLSRMARQAEVQEPKLEGKAEKVKHAENKNAACLMGTQRILSQRALRFKIPCLLCIEVLFMKSRRIKKSLNQWMAGGPPALVWKCRGWSDPGRGSPSNGGWLAMW